MKSFRFFGIGLAIASAVALIAAAPPGYAKDIGGVRVTTVISYHDFSIPDLSIFAALPAYQTERLSTGAISGALIKHDTTYAPAPSMSAVLATTQAGWRSSRLRRLSVG